MHKYVHVCIELLSTYQPIGMCIRELDPSGLTHCSQLFITIYGQCLVDINSTAFRVDIRAQIRVHFGSMLTVGQLELAL